MWVFFNWALWGGSVNIYGSYVWSIFQAYDINVYIMAVLTILIHPSKNISVF